MTASRSRLLRRILYLLVGIVILGFLFTRIFVKPPGTKYVTEKVTKSDVVQTVSVTGTVEAEKRFELQFLNAGRLRDLFVKVGDHVDSGQLLANLENEDTRLQLEAQNAALRFAQANLAKAMAGSRDEEIRIAQYKVQLAEQDLENAFGNSAPVFSIAQSNVEAAQLAFDQAQIRLNQAQEQVYFISNNSWYDPFDDYDCWDVMNQTQEQQCLQDENQRIQDAKNLEDAQYALQQAEIALDQAGENYQKALFDFERQQSDFSGVVAKAELNIGVVQEQLNLLLAGPRDTDVAPFEAQVDQAWESVHLAQYRLDQLSLRAPVPGKVVQIHGEVGENVSPAAALLVLDSENAMIQALVPEADIVKISRGDKVTMTFDAFDPAEEFFGSVWEVAPASTVVQGVVYFEIKVQFDGAGKDIKVGMTANMIIDTETQSDVLTVPSRALQYEGGIAYVQVLKLDEQKQETVEKREISVGLQGDENVEVLSGLAESNSHS